MKRLSKILILVTIAIGFSNYALADEKLGKAKSTICMAYHGVAGISNNDI
ncbi:MAG: hypothetical protein ACI9FB_000547 [Candidatus Azotimanducaceae bacterium]|jgi:hypothetical protein